MLCFLCTLRGAFRIRNTLFVCALHAVLLERGLDLFFAHFARFLKKKTFMDRNSKNVLSCRGAWLREQGYLTRTTRLASREEEISQENCIWGFKSLSKIWLRDPNRYTSMPCYYALRGLQKKFGWLSGNGFTCLRGQSTVREFEKPRLSLIVLSNYYHGE